MPSRSSSRAASIDKLDFDSNRRRPASSHDSIHSGHSGLLASDESFFSNVVDGVVSLNRRSMVRKVTKYASFASAILNCLCAGSITAYSLYGPLFLSRLHYTQFQVNAISTTAEVAMYLPIPLFGWLCDRYSPRPLSAAAAFLFGGGYLLAALTYRAGPGMKTRERGGIEKQEGWPFGAMIIAFIGVGAGTACMYLSAVTTCAKNFGRGKRKGLALAMPIAAFGLSGMWQSQVGSHFFQEEGDTGETDVFRYFLFLACLLFVVGLIGAVMLRVVNEEELIAEAVDELERSGLLEESPLFHRSVLHDSDQPNTASTYGTITQTSDTHSTHSITSTTSKPTPATSALKKTLLLNTESRLFLSDPTMWLLALGFFLTTGPGEAYINNLGTILRSLYPPPASPPKGAPALHVSIVALCSTLARLATGFLADLLSPSPSHSPTSPSTKPPQRISRLTFLLVSTLLFSAGQLLLATPLIQHHPPLYPLVSALVGLGYGAIFSLTPIIVSVVWGVENFGTNWGIVAVAPAVGAALWGGVYSAFYQAGIDGGAGEGPECFGWRCYGGSFVGMCVASWVAIVVWGFAWRGWRERGVVV